MPNQPKKPQPAAQPGDPLFTLHHAEAEAALQRQNPVAMTTSGLSANDSGRISSAADIDDDEPAGPIDRQGQRRGLPPTTSETGSVAGHR